MDLSVQSEELFTCNPIFVPSPVQAKSNNSLAGRCLSIAHGWADFLRGGRTSGVRKNPSRGDGRVVHQRG